MKRLRSVAIGVAAFAVWSLAAPASAELVFLTSGRTMSVKAHRVDGDSIVLSLRTGGEVACQRSLVDRIEPDEVPYPDPPAPRPFANVSTTLEGVPYADLIDNLAQVHGVDPILVKALIKVESGFNPRARS